MPSDLQVRTGSTLCRAVIGAAWLVVALVSPAAAHGDVVSLSPDKGTRAGSAPARISIELSEAPSPAATRMRITDGCGRSVARAVSVKGPSMIARVGRAEPGRWKVGYRTISSVDGHETFGRYSFTVAGRKDCSPDRQDKAEDKAADMDRGNGDGGDAGGAPEGSDGGAAAPASDRDGSSFPLVPVALIAGGIAAVALIARLLAAR